MLQGVLALSLWFWYDGPWAQLFVKYVSNGTCPFNIIITDNWEDQQFMKLQRLLSLVRKAVDDYQMISAGDRIAIGISGGKDSLALLFALHELQRFYPFPFELCAFTVDLGFGIQDFKAIQALCDDFSIPYTVISTDIAKIVFETRRESNPCSLCAKMRKGALNQQARSCGCAKWHTPITGMIL